MKMVRDDQLFTSALFSYRLTPHTNIGASLLGAEMMTFLAPPTRCAAAFSFVVKNPVDSTMCVAPVSFHGMASGFIL